MSKIVCPKRILLIRLDRIGDVVLSTPVVKALRKAHPDSYIAMMVSPYARDIVAGNPYLDEVIIYDKNGKDKGALNIFRLAVRLRKKDFDTVVVLHPSERSHLISFLAGIPTRVGYDRKFSFLLTKRIPHTKQYGLKHESDYALDMVRYIGVDASEKDLFVPVSDISEKKIADMFEAHGVTGSDKIIVFNPGASCASKRWPPERFAHVADMCVRKHGARVVVISGHSDKINASNMVSCMSEKYLNLTGYTTVSDLPSVLKRAMIFVSNDSGPVHIACAVGTPVIAIFGRNDRGLSPDRWGPIGKRDVVLKKDVGCHICLAHNCRSAFKCLDAITVDDVMSSIDTMLTH